MKAIASGNCIFWHNSLLLTSVFGLSCGQQVEKLREQLQKERDLKESLESGLMNIRRGQLPITAIVDCKVNFHDTKHSYQLI